MGHQPTGRRADHDRLRTHGRDRPARHVHARGLSARQLVDEGAVHIFRRQRHHMGADETDPAARADLCTEKDPLADHARHEKSRRSLTVSGTHATGGVRAGAELRICNWNIMFFKN